MIDDQKTIEKNKSSGQKHNILCINCANLTNHKTISSINTIGNVGGWYDYKDDYEIIQCLGCEQISFRHQHMNSEDHPPVWNDYLSSYEEDMNIYIYPKRTKYTREIKSFQKMHLDLRKIYKETINCYNNENLILCGAGVRATVESLCKENNIKNGLVIKIGETKGTSKTLRKSNLEGKINGLVEKDLLTKLAAITLHELRFLGNTAIHDIKSISKEELSIAINILEIIFNNIYEIPHKGDILKEKRTQK